MNVFNSSSAIRHMMRMQNHLTRESLLWDCVFCDSMNIIIRYTAAARPMIMAMMSNPLAPRPEILSCAAFRNESVDPILAAAGRMPAVSAAAAAHILLVRFFMIPPPLS